jgi:hypothetical protein
MRSYLGGLGVVGVLVALVIVAILVLKSLEQAQPRVDSDGNGTEPASTPRALGRNQGSPRAQAEDGVCRANCEATTRTCRSTAEEGEAQEECVRQGQACTASCR